MHGVGRIAPGFDSPRVSAIVLEMREELAKLLALQLAAICVRNTCIEDIHAGRAPQSETGDGSDVMVVTPTSEIPWNEVSRISDAEMRMFMKEVVNKIYTVLLRYDDPAFVERLTEQAHEFTRKWDEPENLQQWFTGKWNPSGPGETLV